MKRTFYFFIGILLLSNSAMAQGTLTPAMKERMIKEILKEKTHYSNIVADDDEKDVSSMMRTTTTAPDKKISSVTTSSISEGETAIIVDPNDTNNLVLSYMQQSGSGLIYPIYYSANGGSSWTRSSFNPLTIDAADFPGHTLIGGGDPAFAWDKVSGTLYYAWIYVLSNATHDTAVFALSWAYSTDLGKTWQVRGGEAHLIGQGFLDPNSGVDYAIKDGICDREWLTVDNSGGPRQGTLYCSFINFENGGESVKVKAPADTAFGTIHLAYSGSSQFGNVEVDKAGVLHMSVADVSANSIEHVSSSNGGINFSSPHEVYVGSNLFGKAGIVHSRENAAPNLATDAAGTLHLVWCDFAGGVVAFYSRSTDGGLNWSNPRQIDSLSTLTAGSQTLMPTVAASGNSVSISVTVIDNNDSARYYQYTSKNNGSTFDNSPMLLSSTPTYYPQYISSPTVFFGDYNRSVSVGCQTFAIWEDGRKTQGPKVYTATTNHCVAGVREVTAVNASLQLASIYPNPAADHVILKFSDTKEEVITVQIHDMSGKLVAEHLYNTHNGEQNINIPLNLNTAMYVLSVSNEEGIIATRNLSVVK